MVQALLSILRNKRFGFDACKLKSIKQAFSVFDQLIEDGINAEIPLNRAEPKKDEKRKRRAFDAPA
jgi:hypothetical protein